MKTYTKIIKNVEVFGLERSVAASRYPMAVDVSACPSDITKGTLALAQCRTGTGHDQFLTGIIVQFDLTFTVKAWVEAERYHFFDFVSSQSTMHKAAKFDISSQCIGYVSPEVIAACQGLQKAYKKEPTPENYLKLLYNLPVGFRLTARMTTNYRQLKTIYQQRKDHRLPEWRCFCDFIEGLPFSEFITGEKPKVQKEYDE